MTRRTHAAAAFLRGCLASVLTAAALTAAAQAQTNLLTNNPSFESGTPGGGHGVTAFPGWTFNYFRYDGWATVTGDATNGHNSLSLNHGGVLTTAADSRPAVTPGVVYRLGFDAKTTQDTNPASFIGIIPSVLFYGADGGLIREVKTVDVQAGTTSPWRHYAFTAVAPAGAVRAGVQVLENGGVYPDEDARAAQVDNFSLVAVPEAADTVRLRRAPTLVVPGQSAAVVVRYTATKRRIVVVRLLSGGAPVASAKQAVAAGRGFVTESLTVPAKSRDGNEYRWVVSIVPRGAGRPLDSRRQDGVVINEKPSGSGTSGADNPDIVYAGRVDRADPKNVALYWGGSQVIARFQGTSCRLRIANADGESFVAGVDGAPASSTFTVTGGVGTAASGLADGEHTIVITKNSESDHWATFQGFVLDPGKGLLQAPPLPPRRIEAYGDSITSGVLPDPVVAHPDPNNDADYAGDWERTYLAYAGRALGAEYRPISKGATGVSGSFVFPYTLRDYWDRLDFDGYTPAKARRWDFSRWTPDVVLISIGQNDQFRKPSEAAFVQAYRQFVRDVRAVYPRAEIFCFSTTMSGPGAQWKDAVLPLLASDPHLHFNQFDGQDHGGHPRLQEHRDMALGSGKDRDPSSYDVSDYALADWVGDVLDYGSDPIGTAAYFDGTAPRVASGAG